ncbi:MAG TPA: class I SAM-dependent methyltransferase [Chitinophagaceae bacterium]|nr:class I SAM-dependent methyltransferase [Chitinophagaceae bacterium]
MNNINDNYFDGYYKDIWRALIPAELTSKEVDFMLNYFKLGKGSRVLDIMCGYGRHAIELAKRGLEVTAVDNLEAYIEEINKAAKINSLSLEATQADVLQYKINKQFDLALCMGNSLNFFNGEDVHRLLVNVHDHLDNDGHLLINTWSLAEIAIRNFTPRAWDELNGIKHICESGYFFHPTRVEFESTFLSADGGVEKKKAVDYIFSVAEMETLLNKAGFLLKKIYSIPGKKEFGLGDPRAYIIASKD